MISLNNHHGNPYIGVYCCASNKYVIVMKNAEKELIKALHQALSVEVIETEIAGSPIVGSLASMNSNGIVVSNFIRKEELLKIPDDLEIAIMEEKFNAAGNNILVTDKAALVHPGISAESLKTLEEVLGVEVVQGTIAGISTVGSIALSNDNGIICHPRATDDNVAMLKDLFSVPVSFATLNFGTPWLGACAVANNCGCVLGDKTTPIELGKLEDGLNLI